MKNPETPFSKPSLEELKQAIRDKNINRTIELIQALNLFLFDGEPGSYSIGHLNSLEFRKEVRAFFSRVQIRKKISDKPNKNGSFMIGLGDGGSRLFLDVEENEVGVRLGLGAWDSVKQKWGQLGE